MSWRSLIISHPARLSLRQRQLLIEQEGESIPVPLEDLALVLVEAREVVLTAPLLSALAQNGVTLLTCDEQFLPCGQWLSYQSYHRSLKTLKLQLNAGQPLQKRLWQQIIRAKINNQAWLLDLSGHNIAAERLGEMAKGVRSGDPDNLEAQAAALYFRVLFGDGFRRGKPHPVNSHLNYGYTILRSAIARALVLSGYLPTLGIFHKNELNAFNLADDFIEPYRPLVDYSVWQRWQDEPDYFQDHLESEQKQNLVRLLHYQIGIDKKIFSTLAAMEKTTASIQIALTGKNPHKLLLPFLVHLLEHNYE